jgi:thiamine pyrophosphokinase
MMTSGHEEAWPLIDETVTLKLDQGSRLSVLPVSDLIGLSITGVRWPLDARDVALGSTLTLSNEASGGEVSVSLVTGHGRRAGLPAVSAGLTLNAGYNVPPCDSSSASMG